MLKIAIFVSFVAHGLSEMGLFIKPRISWDSADKAIKPNLLKRMTSFNAYIMTLFSSKSQFFADRFDKIHQRHAKKRNAVELEM